MDWTEKKSTVPVSEKSAAEVNKFMMRSLEELQENDVGTLESKYNHLVYRSGINTYQEQPVLLDPYLPGIMSKIFGLLKVGATLHYI